MSAWMIAILLPCTLLAAAQAFGLLPPVREEEARRRANLKGDRCLRKGIKSFNHNRLNRARGHLENALRFYRITGDWDGQTSTLLPLALTRSRLADKVGALACVEGILEHEGDYQSGLRFQATMAKARILLEHGDIHRSLECYREALLMEDCPSDIGQSSEADPIREALTRVLRGLISMGRENAARGLLAEARRNYEQGLSITSDALYVPLNKERFPFRLGQYKSLIAIEMERLNDYVNTFPFQGNPVRMPGAPQPHASP